MHRQEGFTLIELMIVILIIGILVGIAVPVFLSARSSAEKRTCESNMRTIKSAANVYAATHETYPTSLGQLVPSFIEKPPTCPAAPTASYIVTGGGGAPPAVTCPAATPHGSM
ncbi:MAG: prepilin-type N-terminal cleavage/methylation domain-containing protein [Actinomycetota bacterium]|nr:prepilin-type N-terminal cleavage/methylation domain-containing protein [Actinomycetota bacterium]